MHKLSIVILTHNESDLLKDCLESVKTLQAEIIVVDCGSSDNSVEVAKKFGATVYSRLNNPMMNVNKNFAFTKATGEWILNLDADEQLNPELIKEIQLVLEQNPNVNGYWIPRKNIIFGKWIEHTGWYPDYQLRLFRRNNGKYAGQLVHEALIVEGKSAYLSSPFFHLNYVSVSQFLEKTITNYTHNEANFLIKQGKHVSSMDAVRMPFREFINRYLAQQGYKDGLHGLVLSLLMANYHFIVFCLIWEKQDFSDPNPQHVFPSFLTTYRRMGKEFQYWILTALMDVQKNKLQKVFYRLRRKLQL